MQLKCVFICYLAFSNFFFIKRDAAINYLAVKQGADASSDDKLATKRETMLEMFLQKKLCFKQDDGDFCWWTTKASNEKWKQVFQLSTAHWLLNWKVLVLHWYPSLFIECD